nr:MAG TPA: hypothetical protein [Caudoviricetes sp.]
MTNFEFYANEIKSRGFNSLCRYTNADDLLVYQIREE